MQQQNPMFEQFDELLRRGLSQNGFERIEGVRLDFLYQALLDAVRCCLKTSTPAEVAAHGCRGDLLVKRSLAVLIRKYGVLDLRLTRSGLPLCESEDVVRAVLQAFHALSHDQCVDLIKRAAWVSDWAMNPTEEPTCKAPKLVTIADRHRTDHAALSASLGRHWHTTAEDEEIEGGVSPAEVELAKQQLQRERAERELTTVSGCRRFQDEGDSD